MTRPSSSGSRLSCERCADQVLARPVGRVRLAGEEDLHRALGVGEQLAQAVQVAEQQVGPLVGREAAGEADGQRVGVEELVDLAQLAGRPAVAPVLLA